MKMHWFIWIPRTVMFALACFTVLFSLDAFDGDGTLWQKTLGFLAHNVFFFILILALIFTWKRPLIAAILFAAFGLMMVLLFGGRWDVFGYLAFAGTPILMGALFIIAWLLGKGTVSTQ